MLYDTLISSHIKDDYPVLTDTVTYYTYRQIDEMCSRIGKVLTEWGVQKQNRIIISAERTLSTILLMLACIRKGICFVPVSHSISEETIKAIIKDVEPSLVIGVFHDTDNVRCEPISSLINLAISTETTNDPIEEKDSIVYILYTSGSTDSPKGVVAPEENVEFCIKAINDRLQNSPSDRILCVLPLSFDYGLYQIFLALASGACLVAPPESPIQQIVSYLTKERITGFPAMPAMLNMLLRTRLLTKANLSNIRYITSTGDIFPVALINQIQEAVSSAVIIPMYGLTECKRVSIMPINRTDKTLAGSCGLPLEGVEVWLEGADANGIGELIVCGKNVMAGYWRDEQATNQYYFIDEFGRKCLRTGDFFRIDNEGFLYFISRKKDILKVNGYRIGIAELENKLLVHMKNLVNELGVFGFSDDIIGERIAVCISTSESREIIIEKFKEVSKLLSAEQRPHFLYCTSQPLPKNENGKIDRKQLINMGNNKDYVKLR